MRKRFAFLLSGLVGCAHLTPYEEIVERLPEERLLELDGRRVHLVREGDGPPLILLHGFGGSSWSWREVVPELAKAHQVVAIDLHGFGWTERPREPEAYTLRGQERLVLTVADRLGFERFDLMGHSYGGAISIFLAGRNPERVGKLVLVDAAMPRYGRDRRQRVFASRTLARFFVRSVGLTEGRVRRGLEAAFADDSRVTEELVNAYLERLRVEGLEDAFYGLTAPARDAGDPEVELSSLRAEVLLVWGEQDELIRPAAGEKMASQIPGARLEVLPACGHNPMEECPEAFLAVVEPFLERSAPATTSGASEAVELR